MLSRALGDSAAVTSPLIPWNSCGAYMAATLGVATTAYVPFAFFNLLNPLISIAFAFLGLQDAADVGGGTGTPTRPAARSAQLNERSTVMPLAGFDPMPSPATAPLALAAGAPAVAQQASAADIDRMMAVIEAQQAQIDAMRAELNALKAAQPPNPGPPGAGGGPATASASVPAAAPGEDDRTEAQMVAEGFTWRDQSGRSLTLSGQVNPAFNVVDDGISTDVFIVDNDTSGTRFRLDADAPLGETSFGCHHRDRREPEQLLRRLAARPRRPTPTSTSAGPR